MTYVGIYSDLHSLIFPENGLPIYGEHKTRIEDFLSKPSSSTAKALFKFISEIQNKETLYNYLDTLKAYEDAFKSVLKRHRDHFLHSANVYLIGLALFNRIPRLRNALQVMRHDSTSPNQIHSFLFRWSLAACLHDLAYPFELALRAFHDYFLKVQENRANQGAILKIDNQVIEKFDQIPRIPRANCFENWSCLGLIARRIKDSLLKNNQDVSEDNILRFIKKKIFKSNRDGIIDHGVISALILLNKTSDLYSINTNWDIKNFLTEIVDSGTAIFLHNFFFFSELNTFLNLDKFPLFGPSAIGYLLYSSDSICEWMRTGKDDRLNYGLSILDDETVIVSGPQKGIDKIKEALEKLGTEIRFSYQQN